MKNILFFDNIKPQINKWLLSLAVVLVTIFFFADNSYASEAIEVSGSATNNYPLPGWVMLAILLGMGILLVTLVWFIGRTKGSTAEDFLTGGRSIGHGMIHASVIATWIWAATLMVSSWTGYSYGYIGPWWYGLGAIIPLPIIGFLGKRLRKVMPNVRSYPEFIKFRLDNKSHVLLTIISIIVSCSVGIMIVTGATVMVIAFADLPFWLVAALFLTIFVSYTSIAGLWASVFADSIMTLLMYATMGVIIIGTLFLVGPGNIYDGLVTLIQTKPVLQPGVSATIQANQYDPLNWLNIGGIGFLIVNIIGNLGAIICNQTYWARTIASEDSKTITKSFLTAATSWAPIPIAVATSLGLYALSKMLVVGQTYNFHGIPMQFTEAEAVAPLSAFLILGFVGLLCFLTGVFGASISTGAGEILSVTTCVVNDIYKGYIKKDATDKEVLFQSKLWLFITAAVLYFIVIYLRSIHFPFAGMYQAMGISFSSAVIPVVLALVWGKTNRNGVFGAIIIGAVSGILYWWSVGFDMAWGVVWSNIIVMVVSLVVVVLWSLIKPEKFDYASMKDMSITQKETPISKAS